MGADAEPTSTGAEVEDERLVVDLRDGEDSPADVGLAVSIRNELAALGHAVADQRKVQEELGAWIELQLQDSRRNLAELLAEFRRDSDLRLQESRMDLRQFAEEMGDELRAMTADSLKPVARSARRLADVAARLEDMVTDVDNLLTALADMSEAQQRD